MQGAAQVTKSRGRPERKIKTRCVGTGTETPQRDKHTEPANTRTPTHTCCVNSHTQERVDFVLTDDKAKKTRCTNAIFCCDPSDLQIYTSDLDLFNPVGDGVTLIVSFSNLSALAFLTPKLFLLASNNPDLSIPNQTFAMTFRLTLLTFPW